MFGTLKAKKLVLVLAIFVLVISVNKKNQAT